MCTTNIYRNWLLSNMTRQYSEAWQIRRETGENTPIHSGNKQRQGLSWKNKPSGGLEDSDCLCADGRERAGWPGYAGCLSTHTHLLTLTNTNLFLNDVALAGCVEGLLPLGLCGLSLLLLLLFSELLDPLQLLLDRSCLDCHHVPNLCRQ